MYKNCKYKRNIVNFAHNNLDLNVMWQIVRSFYFWISIIVVTAAAYFINYFYCLPKEELIEYSTLFSIIGVIVSAALAVIIFILNIKVQSTESMVMELKQQNKLTIQRMNEEKNGHVKLYRTAYANLALSIFNLKRFIETTTYLEKHQQEVYYFVSDIEKCVGILSTNIVNNSTFEYSSQYTEFLLNVKL